MTPRVSIVLPVYNQAHYLPQALDGVFAQTYSDYELIAVDDGSTDGTAAVLAQYQQQHDFTVISQQNRGLPRALNAGFAQARGEYLTWTSSDNVMLPDMLQVLVQTLDDDPAVGLVYADFYLMDEKGKTWGRFETLEYDPYWLLYTNPVRCCFLYRRACRERVGNYDPEFIYGEDWEYWIRISEQFQMKRAPHALYKYRLHRDSMTGEIQRGTADKLTHDEFAARIRRRMPRRWYGLRLKRLGAQLRGGEHPVLQEREKWLQMTAPMAGGEAPSCDAA